jgi:hypothetical protein
MDGSLSLPTLAARSRPDEGQGASYDDGLDTGLVSPVKGDSCRTLNFDALNPFEREFLARAGSDRIIWWLAAIHDWRWSGACSRVAPFSK